MTLSESLSKVDWKLNDLLVADRRAREYARQSGHPESPAENQFAPWAPRDLDAEQKADERDLAESTSDMDQPPSDSVASAAAEDEEAQQETDAAAPDIEALVANARAAGESSGYARASAELEDEIKQQRGELQQLIDAISSTRVDLGVYVDFVRELAMLLAERVVREELLGSQEKLQKLVEQAIERLGAAVNSKVEIFVNARTLEVLRNASISEQAIAALHEDRHLGDGDFRFKIGATESVESVHDSIRNIVSALFDGAQYPPQAESAADSVPDFTDSPQSIDEPDVIEASDADEFDVESLDETHPQEVLIGGEETADPSSPELDESEIAQWEAMPDEDEGR